MLKRNIRSKIYAVRIKLNAILILPVPQHKLLRKISYTVYSNCITYNTLSLRITYKNKKITFILFNNLEQVGHNSFNKGYSKY